jgi:transglutaminase-like putative cysteine protease
MPAVIDWDSQRNVITEKINPIRKGIWKDPQSGTVISFWDSYLQPSAGSSLVIEEQFAFTCYEVNCRIDLGKVTEYEKTDPQYLLYTRPEKYLEADDPNIMKTAEELTGNKTNPYLIARSIYEWVIDHMLYQDIDGLGGAKFAFENRYGECGDYSALFVALCRAAGIPARPVVGRWATSIEGDWHVWAEF